MKHLAGADGVRAVACLMVIGHHLFQWLDESSSGNTLRQLKAFVMQGDSGVSVFFVLSGFLLSYPFWRSYLSGQGYPGLWQYAWRRAARIVPGFYLSLVVSFVAGLALVPDMPHSAIRFAAGVAFLSGFHWVTMFPSDLNAPLWSISFEVFCYVLLPLVMGGLYFVSGARRSFGRALAYWIVVEIVVMLLHSAVLQLFGTSDYEKGWDFGPLGGAKEWMPQYNPLGFFAHFVVGAIAAGVTIRLDAARRRRSARAFDLVGAGALLSILAVLWLCRDSDEFAFSIGRQPYFFPAFALLVGLLLAVLPHSGLLARAFDLRLLRYTGRVSFGLYLWHYLIIQTIRIGVLPEYRYDGMQDIPLWIGVSLAALAAAYLAADLSWRLVERPVLDRVRDRTRLAR